MRQTRGLLALLTACAPAEAPDDAPDTDLTFCEAGPRHRYDPVANTELLAFPDDALTRVDATSPTGLRLDLDADRTPWLTQLPPFVQGLFSGLDELSGFARTGRLFVQLDGALGSLPTDAAASLTDPGLQLWDLGAQPPVRVPYAASVTDDGQHLWVDPLVTLSPGTRHALVLTRNHTTADGGCVVPASATRAVLSGTASEQALRRLVEPAAAFLNDVGLAPADVGALLLFTTHDELATGAVPVVADLRSQVPAWPSPAICEPYQEVGRRCEGMLLAHDYRVDRVLGDGTVRTPWTLPVSMWLPNTEAPPLVLFGHGLGSSRGEADEVARLLVPMGFAVASVDAVEHGDHPTAADNGDADALAFLGLDLEAFTFDGRALRGNFEQTAIDRVQLLHLLRTVPDVDGDGVDDLDPDRMATWGVSLGAMIGSSVLALDGGLDAGLLQVAGGGLIRFATDTEDVRPFLPLFYDIAGSEEALERLLVVGQTLVDPADPATYGAHVLRDRLDDAPAPHLLVPVAIFDDTVPPATARALARALRLPQVPPVVEAVPPLEASSLAPLAGNLGGRTAGYFQFDRVTRGDAVQPAGHGNTPLSPEGQLQALRFFETWAGGGVPEILDPFDVLGTAPLPAR